MRLSDSRKQVPETVRTAKIDNDEQNSHGDSCNRHRVAHEHHVSNIFTVKDIRRYSEHDGRCRDAHQEGEIGNIKPPRHLVCHIGHNQAIPDLVDIEQHANNHKYRQETDPHPVAAAAVQHLPDAFTDE